MYAQSILYDTMVSNTEDGYVGCLAEDWTISDDGRIYTFNIRDGVTFSDGTPCDANAILANFNAILENRERHTWLEMMNLLVGVSAPDEDTFVIEMSEPYYPMLTELACIRPFAMISPNCMIDGSTMNGVNGYIGTGPYVLTDFVTDEYAVFERNENYWGEAPAIQKITVKVIPDNQTRIMALENEEIDLIFGKNMLDADAISQYVDSDRFTVSLSDPTSTRHIVLNTTHDILGDTAVRKALQHATNRQAISEGIFYGLEPAADTLYSPTVPYCDVDLEPYAYDTEEAARLLDEAGWVMGSDGGRSKNGQKLELDLLYNSDSVTEKTISEYLQSEYLKLGISLNIHGEEEQSYRDNTPLNGAARRSWPRPKGRPGPSPGQRRPRRRPVLRPLSRQIRRRQPLAKKKPAGRRLLTRSGIRSSGRNTTMDFWTRNWIVSPPSRRTLRPPMAPLT